MNIDALAAISIVLCGICAGAIAACIAYGVRAICRADRSSQSQLRRSLGTLEGGR